MILISAGILSPTENRRKNKRGSQSYHLKIERLEQNSKDNLDTFRELFGVSVFSTEGYRQYLAIGLICLFMGLGNSIFVDVTSNRKYNW